MKNTKKTATATATATAYATFAQAQTSNPKQKKTRHTLSVWEEKVDKDSEKARVASMFEAMLEEQRGVRANCKLFASYAKDSRMLSLIRLKGIKAREEDFLTIFTPEFISENIEEGFGRYRYNSAHTFCVVTLPASDEKREEYESLGYEKTEPNKAGKFGYLVPRTKYTFLQFTALVKQAVENYRRAE